MKRTFLLSLLLPLGLAMAAQTMKIHRGPVTVAVSADRAGMMTLTGGTQLDIAGTTFNLAEADSITFGRETVADSSVSVRYDGNTAHLTVSADVWPQLAVNVSGACVSVVASPELQSEVVYTLSGSSTAGHFFMDGEYKARLVLDNLTLTAADSSAIEIANGKRIDVVLPEGTVTTLTDRAGGTHKACFFVNGHPEFSGAGTLRMAGRTKHAFASDEYTRLCPGFGSIEVTEAEGDGMHVDQYFSMEGGNVSIVSKGDGIDVSLTKDPLDAFNGEAFISGGTLTLSVASPDVKGLKTEKMLTISGGSVTATVTGDGSKGISAGTDLLICDASGTAPRVTMTVTGTTYMPGDPVLEAKCRGIKVKGNFTFDGGDIRISATGYKSKAVSVDGGYIYKKGSIDCAVDSAF